MRGVLHREDAVGPAQYLARDRERSERRTADSPGGGLPHHPVDFLQQLMGDARLLVQFGNPRVSPKKVAARFRPECVLPRPAQLGANLDGYYNVCGFLREEKWSDKV